MNKKSLNEIKFERDIYCYNEWEKKTLSDTHLEREWDQTKKKNKN